MGAVRWRYEFYSRDAVLWKVDIYDPSSSVGSPHEFTYGQGFTLDYETSNNKTPFSTFIFSAATISIVAKDSTDLTQLNNLINADSEELVADIYKDGSIFWRGIITPDLIIHENRSVGVVYSIPATDGLKRLQRVQNSSISAFSTNIIRGLVTIFNATGVSESMAASDTILRTANRWYENNMTSTGTGVDPLTITRFTGTSFWTQEEVNGDIIYLSYYDILEAFLKAFGLRCFMGPNGAYHVVQNDQYAQGVLYLFAYPKNYTSGTVTPTNFDPDITNPSIRANGQFAYSPIIRSATGFINVEDGGNIINSNQRSDWQTQRSIATLTQFDASTQVDLTFLSGPTITWEYSGALTGLFLRSLKCDISIKLVLDSTYYLTNTTGGLTWSTSSADVYKFRTNNVNFVTRSSQDYVIANASNPQLALTFPPLPTSGALTLEIDAELIDPAGNVISTGFTLDSTIAKITAAYTDPTTVNGRVNYFAENTDTKSSYALDLGEFLVSDLITANYQNTLSVYNGSTWVFGTNWKRQAAGTARNIITLGIYQILEWQDKNLQIISGTVIDTDLTALSRLELGSVKYVLNRASFNANLDEWNGSWIEFQTASSGPTIGLDNPSNESNNVVIGSGKRARPDNTYFDLIENSVLRITNTSDEHSGTITVIDIDTPNFDIANSGETLLIVDPVTGESDTLELDGEILSASNSFNVVSVSLSRTYPKGSYIYMPIGQVLQRIYNLENP